MTEENKKESKNNGFEADMLIITSFSPQVLSVQSSVWQLSETNVHWN